MARRRSTASSSTERRVVGDLAFHELLNRALPLLAPDDRRIIGLLQGGSIIDEVTMLMDAPHETGVDARVVRAQEDLARACRTVAATASLLEGGDSCPEFARYAAWWRRLLNKQKLLQTRIAEASRNYERFAMVTDRGQMHFYIDNYLWSRAKFLAAAQEAKEAYGAARTEASELSAIKLKMDDIASHATAHASTCMDCQQEVQKILGQNWSPF
jgi:hypothetical protein